MAKAVKLSDDVHQPPNAPVAYLVFGSNGDSFVFQVLSDAVDFLCEDEPDADGYQSREIYPLWASAGFSVDNKLPNKWR